MENDNSASNPLGSILLFAVLATFPGLRKALGVFGLLGLVACGIVIWLGETDVISWSIYPNSYPVVNNIPGIALLVSFVFAAVLFGIWLPAAIAAAVARRWMTNIKEYDEED